MEINLDPPQKLIFFPRCLIFSQILWYLFIQVTFIFFIFDGKRADFFEIFRKI